MKKRIGLTVMIFILIAVIGYGADVINKKWNDKDWNGNYPVLSVDFIGLDSANNTITQYNGDFRSFDTKAMTLGYVFKAPANDSIQITILGRSRKATTSTPAIFDTVWTSAVLVGAASYTYTAHFVQLTFSNWAKEYAIKINPLTTQNPDNSANDTLALTFTPSTLNADRK